MVNMTSIQNVENSKKKRGKLRDHKDSIIKLYQVTQGNPFYSQKIDPDVFSPNRIHMLVMRGIISSTGNSYIGDHKRKYNEWVFTKKGKAFVDAWSE